MTGLQLGSLAGQATTRSVDVEAVLHDLPDHLPELIALVDTTGILHWYNSSAEAALGWQSPEWIGRSVLEIVHPRDHQIARDLAFPARRAPTPAPVIRVASSYDGWAALEPIVAAVDVLPGPPLLLVSARRVTAPKSWNSSNGAEGERSG
jgi:PAS domain-containing protein